MKIKSGLAAIASSLMLVAACGTSRLVTLDGEVDDLGATASCARQV